MDMSGLLHALAALLRVKELRHLLNMRLGGSQRSSGRFGEEERSFVAVGHQSLDRPLSSPFIILTTLFQLHLTFIIPFPFNI
jgi:hypothetical protein